MKKHFLTLLILTMISLIFYFVYEHYDRELQNIHAEKISLQNANERLAEQLEQVSIRVDSLSIVSTDQAPVDLARISEILKQSVYKIIVWSKKEDTTTYDILTHHQADAPEYDVKIGTAFCIFEDNVLITNHHVIGENAEFALLVDIYDKRVPVSKVVLTNGKLDYAIIKAEGLHGKPLAPSTNEISEGIQIVTMGNPLELDFTPSVGWITSLRLNNNVLQISNPITHGNSGGPVIDKNGNLLGLVYGGFQSNAMLNFAVNIHSVMHDIENKTGIQLCSEISSLPDPTYQSVYEVMGPNTTFSPEVAKIEGHVVYEQVDLPPLQYGNYPRHQQ